MDKNKTNLLLAIIIITLAVFLRSYNLYNRIGFNWDQERDAFAVKSIIVDKKPALIGPRVVNDNGFFLGPYFFYLLTPFYLITRLHPYATVLFVETYALSFFVLSFFLLKKIFNYKTALIFIILWAVNPLTISIDTIAWNPVLVPLLELLLFYLLDTFSFSSTKFWIILGFLLGISVNIHVQMLFICLFSLLFFVFNWEKTIKHWKNTIYSMVAFLATFLPLLIFDLRHNFLNSKLLFQFGSGLTKDYSGFFDTWHNFVSAMLTSRAFFLPYIIWFLVLALLCLNLKKKLSKPFIVIWLVFPLIFLIYGHRPSEYYFNFLLPIIFISVSVFLSSIKLKPYLLLTILAVIFFSFIRVVNLSDINGVSLKNKTDTVSFIKSQAGSFKTNVSFDTPIGQNSGFAYLIDYNRINITNNPADPLFQVIIPAQTNLPTFGSISVKSPTLINK